MFSLVVPFHRDVTRLERVFAAHDEARRYGISEILFCHNGPPLDAATVEQLQRGLPPDARFLHVDERGIGAGYRLGIEHARAPWTILSASDLPFGFSDVRAFVELSPRSTVAIGSKAHRDSKLPGWSATRRAAGFAFYLLRRVLLGRATPGDSQGTIIIETELARRLLPEVESNDYFFSLEILTLAAEQGFVPIELPVQLEDTGGSSSVSLVRDSIALARKTWSLRRRLRSPT